MTHGAVMFEENYTTLCTQPFVARETAEPFSGPTPQKLREKVVAHIWADQLIETGRLATACGKPVTVIAPGWENLAEGPDFRHAILEIDGTRVKGDVEIHTYASHWYQHKHDSNPVYDRVILHVVMWNNRTSTSVRGYSAGAIPMMVLSDVLIRPLQELEKDTVAGSTASPRQEDPRLTPERLQQLTGSDFGKFLDAAGDWRILDKARRFLVAFKRDDVQEVFYRMLMEAFGYVRNRAPFSRVAYALPLQSLAIQNGSGSIAETRERLLGQFAAVAGLLPELSGRHDGETAAFAQRLRETSVEPARGALSRSDWTRKGVRPANQPIRRLAAAANFLAKCRAKKPLDFFVEAVNVLSDRTPDKKRAGKVREAMIEHIADGPDHYFHYHYTIGAKRLASRRELVGKQLAITIIVNVVVPAILAISKKTGNGLQETALHNLYRHIPKQADDNITKFVKTRILDPEQARLVNTARRQQALYQIYNDLVLRDSS